MLNSTINQDLVNVVYIPFTKGFFIDLNIFYYFLDLVIVGCANAEILPMDSMDLL